jgi:hypothetical protein
MTVNIIIIFMRKNQAIIIMITIRIMISQPLSGRGYEMLRSAMGQEMGESCRS